VETGKDGRVANVGQPGLCARSGVMLQTGYGRTGAQPGGTPDRGSGRGTAGRYTRQGGVR